MYLGKRGPPPKRGSSSLALAPHWRRFLRAQRLLQSGMVDRNKALRSFTSSPSCRKGLGPDDRDRLQDRWKPSIQLDQEQPIPIRELDTTTQPPLQHNQLMSERGGLCLKSAPRLERRDQQGQEEGEQRDHSATTLGDSFT